MRITSKGQVAIPRAVRERFGLLPPAAVCFRVHSGQVLIEKAK